MNVEGSRMREIRTYGSKRGRWPVRFARRAGVYSTLVQQVSEAIRSVRTRGRLWVKRMPSVSSTLGTQAKSGLKRAGHERSAVVGDGRLGLPSVSHPVRGGGWPVYVGAGSMGTAAKRRSQ
jgi:hypothetical protein